MDLHGGRIGASSEGEGEGTTFYVILPLYPAVAVAGRASTKSRVSSGAKGDQTRRGEASAALDGGVADVGGGGAGEE